jgi:hypothetical protein
LVRTLELELALCCSHVLRRGAGVVGIAIGVLALLGCVTFGSARRRRRTPRHSASLHSTDDLDLSYTMAGDRK